MKVKKYKLKTHKSTAKRLKVTASGKIIRKKISSRNNSHKVNMRGKARKLMPEKFVIDSKANVKKVKKLLNI